MEGRSSDMDDMSDLEWDIVSAIFGHRAQMDDPSINTGTPPQRIDIAAAHRIKDRILRTIKTHLGSERALLWDEGFSDGMHQWALQHADPSHPITRTNPYQEN